MVSETSSLRTTPVGHVFLANGGERAVREKAPAGPGVPGFIWAAIGAVTVLTLGFLIPAIHKVIENQKLTFGAVLILVLVLQNTLTLFFAPVVLRRERHFQGG